MAQQESKNWISEQEFDKLCREFHIMQQFRRERSVKLMSIEPEDLSMALRVIFGCALRPKELFNVQVLHFDLENLILSLPVTKTGFKPCKCSKWEKPKDGKKKICIYAKKDCEFCSGIGKIRKIQYTTILRKDANALQEYFRKKKLEPEDYPFPYYKQILGKYMDEAGKLAGLKIFSTKENRMIYNAYPYILRESRSKIMEDMGAKDSLVKLKLRHSRSANLLLRYQMPDLASLKAWELENYK